MAVRLLKIAATAGLALALAAVATPDIDVSPTHVTSPPSSVALSPDGATLFVGLDRLHGHGGGLAAFARDGASLRQLAFAAVPGGVTGLALTPDGSTLIAATRIGLAAVSTAALVAGTVRAVTVVRDSDAPRTSQVVVSADGRYAFATNSATATLGVARIAGGAAPSLQYVAHVALDPSPDGLALSPDGTTIYVASEVAANAGSVPGAGDPRLGRTSCAVNLGPNGVVSAVDVAKAVGDPSHAVVARIAAGCAPARVAVSANGRIVWVSVRGEDRILAFDAMHLDDPRAALLAAVPVGHAPIGLAYSRDGSDLLVANSAAGDDSDDAGAASLSLVDANAALRGEPPVRATIATGKLAREVISAPGRAFLVTVYGAMAVDAVSLPTERNDHS